MRSFVWILVILRLFGIGLLQSSEEEYDSSEYGVVTTKIKNNCSCGWANKNVLKTPGRKPEDVNVYPMIAGLVHLRNKTITCSGTIITSRHILTINACINSKKPSDFGIHVGQHSYGQGHNITQLLTPQQFLINEKKSTDLDYSIAIILMKEPMVFDDFIGPACLPKESISYGGKIVKLLGWKRVELKGTPVDVLLESNVKVQSQEECKKHYPSLGQHEFCTYKITEYTCREDIGGPVLWVDPETNRYVAVGIMANSKSCGLPTVNVDVTYFLPSIQSIISQTDSSLKTCSKENRAHL